MGDRQTTKRLPGRHGDRMRERIRRRDCGLCQECRRRGRMRTGSEVDHVVALTNGGDNDDANLQLLCVECHREKTAKDKGHRPRPAIGPDGYPVA